MGALLGEARPPLLPAYGVQGVIFDLDDTQVTPPLIAAYITYSSAVATRIWFCTFQPGAVCCTRCSIWFFASSL